MKYYPIIIFCFNRPEHLKKLLESIYQNKDYNKHQYFFFCDLYKDKKDKQNNNKVRNIIINSNKIKKKKIILRKKNFGLSENIINGINYVFKKFNAAIIIEDDLLLNKYVLKFLNLNLKKYLHNKKIFSISAYSYLNNLDLKNKNQLYKIRRHSSWGWATWKNKWDRVDFYDLNFFKKKNKNFSKLGNDMNLMMWAQNNNFINSWAVRFNFYCSFFNLFSVQPKKNMIKNIGNDLSGYHKSFRFNINDKFDTNYDPFKKNLISSRIINSKVVDKHIKNSHRPSIKLFIKYLIKKIL
tara:strand:- start:524 stop:1411 length:888 start_codon:yes stop_codon:yes gene_type:complete